jgi:uncharacterized membrane protein YkoI
MSFLVFFGFVMLRLSIGVSLLALAFSTNDNGVFKAESYDSMGKCVQKALAKYVGEIIKVEYEVEDRMPIYEFDIETADGKAWEVECNVKTGEITETEEEVQADDTRFTSQAKVGVETVRATALAAYPGRIIAVEHGLESDGKASYEVDILEVDKEEVKVEIDAATGKVVEVGYEGYQLGEE